MGRLNVQLIITNTRETQGDTLHLFIENPCPEPQPGDPTRREGSSIIYGVPPIVEVDKIGGSCRCRAIEAQHAVDMIEDTG